MNVLRYISLAFLCNDREWARSSALVTQVALPVFLGNRRCFPRTNTENVLIFVEGYDMKKSISVYGAGMLHLKPSFRFKRFYNKRVLQH